MAARSKLAEAFVQIGTDQTGLDSGLAKAFRSTQSTVAKISNVWRGLNVAAGLVGPGSFLDKMNKTYAELDSRNARLAATLRVTGKNAAQNTDRLDDLSNSLKRLVGIDDDLLKEGMISALTSGVSVDNMEDFMARAVGLSRILGVDLSSGVQKLSQAYNGNFKALQAGLPTIRNFKSDEQKLAEVLRLASVGLQQQIAWLNSFAGAAARAKIAEDDFQKALAKRGATDFMNEWVGKRWAMAAAGDDPVAKRRAELEQRDWVLKYVPFARTTPEHEALRKQVEADEQAALNEANRFGNKFAQPSTQPMGRPQLLHPGADFKFPRPSRPIGPVPPMPPSGPMLGPMPDPRAQEIAAAQMWARSNSSKAKPSRGPQDFAPPFGGAPAKVNDKEVVEILKKVHDVLKRASFGVARFAQ